MKRVIDRPQVSDMGSGFGHYEDAAGLTLGEALNYLDKNLKSWGTLTIYRGSYDIIRRFDFDRYNGSSFYHHLSGWQYNFIVREIRFDYCFMSENIDIYVK